MESVTPRQVRSVSSLCPLSSTDSDSREEDIWEGGKDERGERREGNEGESHLSRQREGSASYRRGERVARRGVATVEELVEVVIGIDSESRSAEGAEGTLFDQLALIDQCLSVTRACHT